MIKCYNSFIRQLNDLKSKSERQHYCINFCLLLVIYCGFGQKMGQNPYASINSKCKPPPGQPPGFCTCFQPWFRHLYHPNCPGSAGGSNLLSVIKVPSCQLMSYEGTFQLQAGLPSIAALWLQNVFQSRGTTLKL